MKIRPIVSPEPDTSDLGGRRCGDGYETSNDNGILRIKQMPCYTFRGEVPGIFRSVYTPFTFRNSL